MGKIVWHDLLTTNPESAREFYGRLFGWSFEKSTLRYTVIKHGNKKTGGILQIDSDGGREPAAQWLVSMSIPDTQSAMKMIAGAGGTIINGPMKLGERGEGILVSDAQNAQLILLKSASGDPSDQKPKIGDWLWNEVWTMNLAREEQFYKQLGMYKKQIKEQDYAILINDDQWRMGIRQIKQKAFAGRWIPVVRVADPAALLNKVEALGGAVWTYPADKQQTTLISDNEGAFLILQSWSFPKPTKEVEP